MKTKSYGFTIVELLVVIVVIGILAAITIVSYTGLSSKANVSSLQSDLSSAKKQLALYYTDHGSYPTGLSSNFPTGSLPSPDNRYCLKTSSNNTLTYSPVSLTSPQSYTLVATNTASSTKYVITNNTSPTTFSPNWIAGIAGTALENKWVYNADNGNLTWGPSSALATPQGSIGLDTTPYESNMTLVADNTIDFTAYPARQACKNIGGRLPNVHELQAIYTARVSTYGNNFQDSYYWSSTEHNSTIAYTFYFTTGGPINGLKVNTAHVRCVAG